MLTESLFFKIFVLFLFVSWKRCKDLMIWWVFSFFCFFFFSCVVFYGEVMPKKRFILFYLILWHKRYDSINQVINKTKYNKSTYLHINLFLFYLCSIIKNDAMLFTCYPNSQKIINLLSYISRSTTGVPSDYDK